MSIGIAINGAAGRMGLRLVALGSQDADLRIAAAVDSPRNPSLGRDAGELAGVDRLGVGLASGWPVEGIDQNLDIMNEFLYKGEFQSIPTFVFYDKNGNKLGVWHERAQKARDEMPQMSEIRAAAESIAVCWSPSMSLAVNLTMSLAQRAARALRDVPHGVDVEIIERHHRYKEDAPSGTALKFGELIAAELGSPRAVHGREGRCGARTRDEIGYHAVRTGDDPGQHTIIFGMLGETIEMRVAASNRDCYAQGALAAAKFLVGKPPGLYGMADVLGLES